MPITIDPGALYSPEEAEPVLGQTPATQAKDRSLGRGVPYTKMGRKIFYRGSDLIARVEARRVRHGAEYRAKFETPGPRKQSTENQVNAT